MKLYDLPPSPNARRVRIFIAEKGIEIPQQAVDMAAGENRTDDYLARNSLGKMPVLELDDGTHIAESVAICRYLEELHPEPPMFGRDAVDRARVEMWNRRMEFEILLPMLHVFVHTHEFWKDRVTQITAWGEKARDDLDQRLPWLDNALEGREFIAGDDYTVADITAQVALLMGRAALGVAIPEKLNNLSGWWNRVSGRPTARA
jgi:glutathione S-transferase